MGILGLKHFFLISKTGCWLICCNFALHHNLIVDNIQFKNEGSICMKSVGRRHIWTHTCTHTHTITHIHIHTHTHIHTQIHTRGKLLSHESAHQVYQWCWLKDKVTDCCNMHRPSLKYTSDFTLSLPLLDKSKDQFVINCVCVIMVSTHIFSQTGLQPNGHF